MTSNSLTRSTASALKSLMTRNPKLIATGIGLATAFSLLATAAAATPGAATPATAAPAAATPALAAPAAPTTTTSPDVNTEVKTWAAAAAKLGKAAPLYKPTNTLGLKRVGDIEVITENLKITDGKPTGGKTYVSATYGNKGKLVQVVEKWEGTKLAQPSGTTSSKYDNSFEVALTGGTNVIVKSSGVTESDLAQLVESFTPITWIDTPSRYISAESRSVCRAAIKAGSLEAAREIVDSNGYLLRVGSIDGEFFFGTADWVPSRINVNIVGGRLVGCSYG